MYGTCTVLKWGSVLGVCTAYCWKAIGSFAARCFDLPFSVKRNYQLSRTQRNKRVCKVGGLLLFLEKKPDEASPIVQFWPPYRPLNSISYQDDVIAFVVQSVVQYCTSSSYNNVVLSTVQCVCPLYWSTSSSFCNPELQYCSTVQVRRTIM
jgi:hypothetical protein